jgi:hypothetical protein
VKLLVLNCRLTAIPSAAIAEQTIHTFTADRRIDWRRLYRVRRFTENMQKIGRAAINPVARNV